MPERPIPPHESGFKNEAISLSHRIINEIDLARVNGVEDIEIDAALALTLAKIDGSVGTVLFIAGLAVRHIERSR